MVFDLFKHIFGNLEDYSIERRDISPREGYLLELNLNWYKNKHILPLYLSHSLFWANPGYLNHDLLRYESLLRSGNDLFYKPKQSGPNY